ARIGGELGVVQYLDELEPGPLVRSAQVDPAVLGRKSLVGRRKRMCGTHRARRHTGREGNGRLPIGVRDARLEKRGVDSLALTCLELVDVGGANAHGT